MATLDFRPFKDRPAFRVCGPEGDRSILGQIHMHGTFEPHVIGLLSKVLKPNATILDVGANIGALAVVFSALCPNGKIFCFEASPTTQRFLKQTIKKNRLKNVRLVNRAVFNRSDDHIAFNVTPEFLGGSFFSSMATDETMVQRVKTITLDDWRRQTGLHVDFLKMDIEGSEMIALAGAQETLANDKPDMLIECNAIALRKYHKASAIDLFRDLKNHYRYIYAVIDFDTQGRLASIDDEATLIEFLELGKGAEDFFCSASQPTAVSIAPASDYIRMLREAHGGRRIIIDPQYRLSSSAEELTSTVGKTETVTITLANDGGTTYTSTGVNPVNMSYHVRNAAGSTVVFDGVRTEFAQPVMSGTQTEVEMRLVMPLEPGEYFFDIVPVQEGIAWLDQMHGAVQTIKAVVC